MAGWGSLQEAVRGAFDSAGFPEGRLDLPATPAPPPPAPTYLAPDVLTQGQQARLAYLGLDPAVATPAQIDKALGLPPAPPPAAPPPPVNTNPALDDPPPPAGSDTPTGAAADAAAADAGQVKTSLADLANLDKSSAAALDEIHSAGVQGRTQLDDIQKDLDAKIQQLGPQLNTPQGQQQLREFLKDKLTAAQKIIDTHIAAAEDAARKTHDATQKYAGIGKDDGTTSVGDTSADSSPAGTEPAAADTPVPAPAAAAPAAAAPMTAMPAGMPMSGIPGMGGGMPSIPFPSFGGGGMPGMGGGGSDPFGGGSGGNSHGDPVGFHDSGSDSGSGSQSGDGTKNAAFHDPSTDQTGTGSHTDSGSGAGTQTASTPGGGTPPHTDALVANHDGTTGSDVKMPDGTVVQARNPQEAIAARAAIGGATVGDAYKSAGVDLPPPGTPVTDPLPPTQLQAGDVGVWKDHMVMALGGGKALVNGQVQPLDSLGSGPDFLGWIDPTAHTVPSVPAPPPPPAPSTSS